MNLTTSLLYLLLLYAVLDKNGSLSMTTGLLIGAAILLFSCFCNRPSCPNANNTFSNNLFSTLNTI